MSYEAQARQFWEQGYLVIGDSVCVYRNMRYRFTTSEVIEERAPAGAPRRTRAVS